MQTEKSPNQTNKNQQQATTKNWLNFSEGGDRNLETKFIALVWKKLPYFSSCNLYPGFLEVVGISSITSDPSLILKNLSLRWDLASRNTGSKKDQAFDLHCKGWILQTALQGAPNNVISLVPSSLCFIYQDKSFTYCCFHFYWREVFKNWKTQRVYAYPFLFCFSGMHSCSCLGVLNPSSSMLKACICLAKEHLKCTPKTSQLQQGKFYLLQSRDSTCSKQTASPCTIKGVFEKFLTSCT